MMYGADALTTRPMLYTNPIAEPRSAVGNSSLAITLKPLKYPVPKNPTRGPISSSAFGLRTSANAGTSSAHQQIADVGVLAAEPVGQIAKDDIAQEVPTCITIVHVEVATMLSPRPPSATGIERNRGTQVNRPHQANSVAAFMLAQIRTL
jgi:hypothetical protein